MKLGNTCRGDEYPGLDGFVSPEGTPDQYTLAPSECSCSHPETQPGIGDSAGTSCQSIMQECVCGSCVQEQV